MISSTLYFLLIQLNYHFLYPHFNYFFSDIFSVSFLELTYTRLLPFSHWTPSPVPSKKGNFRDWFLAVPTIFVITNKRDGGTLPDRVPELRVRVPNVPSPNVSGSDIPGPSQSTEGLGPCDTTVSLLEIYIYLEVKPFSIHILLNQLIALVLSNFCFVFFYKWTNFACWLLINLLFPILNN